MKVSEVGSIVRAYRKASGLSQKELAHVVGISRATLNYLESGRELEIGASKLLAILDVLGIPLALPSAVDEDADEGRLDRALKATASKPSKRMPRKVLIEALTTGRPPIGFEAQAAAFMEAADDTTALAAIRCVAASGAGTSAAWKGAKSLAKALNCSKKAWSLTGK